MESTTLVHLHSVDLWVASMHAHAPWARVISYTGICPHPISLFLTQNPVLLFSSSSCWHFGTLVAYKRYRLLKKISKHNGALHADISILRISCSVQQQHQFRGQRKHFNTFIRCRIHQGQRWGQSLNDTCLHVSSCVRIGSLFRMPQELWETDLDMVGDVARPTSNKKYF